MAVSSAKTAEPPVPAVDRDREEVPADACVTADIKTDNEEHPTLSTLTIEVPDFPGQFRCVVASCLSMLWSLPTFWMGFDRLLVRQTLRAPSFAQHSGSLVWLPMPMISGVTKLALCASTRLSLAQPTRLHKPRLPTQM